MKIIFLSFALTLLCLAANATPTPIEIDQSTAKTTFIAVGKPAMLRIHGESQGIKSELTLENKLVNGKIDVQLEKFKTGIDTRDEHMKKKYLEVEKFPEAVLTIADLSVADIKPGAKKDLNFKAKLTLHGVTKEVEVKGNIESMANSKYKIQATSNIKLSDYNIDIPSYAGIKVADSVDFDVQFQTQ